MDFFPEASDSDEWGGVGRLGKRRGNTIRTNGDDRVASQAVVSEMVMTIGLDCAGGGLDWVMDWTGQMRDWAARTMGCMDR